MQHYFGTIADDHAIIDGKQIHHLINVRRGTVGEKIEVSDGTDAFLCVIEGLDPLSIKVLNKIEEKRELDVDLTLAFGVLKGDHNDLIVLKGTELGVAKFIPFTCARTVVVPTVTGYQKFEDVLAAPADLKIFAYEDMWTCSENLLSLAPNIKKHSHILVVIGPEGGFSKEEARLALDYDFEFVSLGKRILRAETAAIYAASIIGAIAEGDIS
ncbi:MAG: 16S rRNA (uracil(1498)-N(3))-methyltransferase [Bacilli bacterium]|nr:16S rRNA (uracil(1498)-N(3))-methyltransferase [Bacilli bacterium]